jgi:transposase-like protein
VERPPYERLMAEIAETSVLAVGRKYGVSDNAVRKWIRWYEYQRERNGDCDEGRYEDQAA